MPGPLASTQHLREAAVCVWCWCPLIKCLIKHLLSRRKERAVHFFFVFQISFRQKLKIILELLCYKLQKFPYIFTIYFTHWVYNSNFNTIQITHWNRYYTRKIHKLVVMYFAKVVLISAEVEYFRSQDLVLFFF